MIEKMHEWCEQRQFWDERFNALFKMYLLLLREQKHTAQLMESFIEEGYMTR